MKFSAQEFSSITMPRGAMAYFGVGTGISPGRRAFNSPVLAIVLSMMSFAGYAEGSQRPNILFFFTDDQPQFCSGCLENEVLQTPNVDHLAQEGLRFVNAFATTSICASSRASILTGQYMLRHGIIDFQTPLSRSAFDETYPVLLRRAGYRTGYIGKYAIGNHRTDPELALPSDRFDVWYGFPQSISYLQKIDGKSRYLTTEMTKQAIKFLQDTPADQPFLLTIAFKEPHGPANYFDPTVPDSYEGVQIPVPETFTKEALGAEPGFIRNSLNGENMLMYLDSPIKIQQFMRTFFRLISRADRAVGEILAELKNLRLDDNTVVIYSSDHGRLLGAHGLSGKWLMYEESIRIPMIIFDPRRPKGLRGQTREEMALTIDIAPTILDYAGVAIPETMQGKSLRPLVDGMDTDWRKDWYYEHTYNTKPPRSPIVKLEGVRSDRWKYTRYTEINPPYEQLFNLEIDPREQNNLAPEEASQVMLDEMRSRCNQYRLTLR